MKFDQRSLEGFLGESIGGYSEPTYDCPFCAKRGHSSNPGHLHVNYKRGAARCHRCQFGTRRLDILYRMLSGQRYKLKVSNRKGSTLSDKVRRSLYKDDDSDANTQRCDLPEEFIPLTTTPKLPYETKIYNYLRSRGLDDSDILSLNIGYAKSGRFDGHVIFPVYMRGALTFYTSRLVVGDYGPKSFHSEVPRAGSLFMYDFIFPGDILIITEGPFDAISVSKLGVGRGTCLFGSTISDSQIRNIKDARVSKVVVCMDADAADTAFSIARNIYRKLDVSVYLSIPTWRCDVCDNRQAAIHRPVCCGTHMESVDPNDCDNLLTELSRAIPYSELSKVRLLFN